MIANGKEIAEHILHKLESKFHHEKKVCFIQFGNDAASTSFINRKKKIAERLHIKADIVHEPTPLSNDWALRLMKEVIAKGYDGIVVQLPLPRVLDAHLLINTVPAAQDIDLLGEEMLLRYQHQKTKRIPPVAFAVAEILSRYNVKLKGKKVVVLGKGKLVGGPVAEWFKQQNVEEVIAFDYTADKEERAKALKAADIVVT
ncbi:MAG: methylenetetrahydrofolate dehydrogenase, partial [Candidatus Parcubacteria bacterium]